jgi:hypothetical protein
LLLLQVGLSAPTENPERRKDDQVVTELLRQSIASGGSR